MAEFQNSSSSAYQPTQDEILRFHEELFGESSSFRSESLLLSSNQKSLEQSDMSPSQPPRGSNEPTNGLFTLTKSLSASKYLRSPVIWSPAQTECIFDVSIQKDPDQGFGMLLRRGLNVERKDVTADGRFLEVRTQAIYAEPGPVGVRIGLLPGDQLISVNGTNVQTLLLAEVVQLIRTFGSSITLSVKPDPEMLEFSNRTMGCVPVPNKCAESTSKNSGPEPNPCTPHAMLIRPKVIRAGGLKNLYSQILETLYGMYLHPTSETPLESFPNGDSSKEYSTPAGSLSRLARLGDRSYVMEYEENIPVWVSTRDGYKSATLLSSFPNGRCRILVLPEREELEVDGEDLERSNPAEFDRIEDVADLRYMNESSIVHTLIQRFGSGQVCTYASGANLLAINPMIRLNIYSEAVMDLFTGCRNRRDMPPHVFSIAQLALARLNRSVGIVAKHAHNMLQSGTNGYSAPESEPFDCNEFRDVVCRQAICLSGRSGSGKSKASLDLLSYLLNQSNRVMAANFPTDGQLPRSITHPRITAERLRALFCMLDAFTSSRILLNTNANRTIRLFSVEYTDLKSTEKTASSGDPNLIISGLTTRLLLFDRTRVTERPEGEPNFHIFYYFLAGLDATSRRELLLTDLDESNLFMTRLHRHEDKEAAQHYWLQLCQDAQLLEFNLEEEWLSGGISRLLAVIYHLGCAGCIENRQSCSSVYSNDAQDPPHVPGFLHMESAHRAAHLLGCPVDYLATAVFGIPDETGRTAMDSLRAFIQGLYQTTVDILLMLINRCLSSESSASSERVASSKVCAQLVICDPPGLQAPSPNSRPDYSTTPDFGTYADLLINYANERLALLSRQTGLELCKSMMKADGLTVGDDVEQESKLPDLVGTLDCVPPTGTSSAPGIFWLIEEAAPTGNLKGLIKKLEELYQNERSISRNRDLRTIRRCRRSGSFVLNHSLSTFPVEYGVDARWFTNCRLYPAVLNAHQLLRRHGPSSIVRLVSLLQSQRDYLGDAKPTWIDQSSVFVEAKQQLDFVIQLLYTCAAENASPDPRMPDSGFNDGGSPSGLHWIHCLLPVVNAGLCQLSSVGDLPLSSIQNGTDSKPLLLTSPARICVNLIRAQLRGLNLTSVLREIRRTYTDRLSLTEFGRRFASLVPKPTSPQPKDLPIDQSVKMIMSALHYAPQFYAVGREQIFLQSFILPQLKLRKRLQKAAKAKLNGAVGKTSQDQSQSNFMNGSKDQMNQVAAPHPDTPHYQSGQVPPAIPKRPAACMPQESSEVNPCMVLLQEKGNRSHTNGTPDLQSYVELVAKFEQTNHALAESYAEIDRLKDQLVRAHSELDRMYGECYEAEHRAREAEQRADHVVTDDRCMNQLPIDRQKQGRSPSFTAMENEVTFLRDRLTQYQRKQEELEDSLSQARSKLEASDSKDSSTLIAELNEVRTSHQELVNRFAELQSELEEAKDDVICAKRECSRLEQELERVRSDSYRITEERDAEVETLRKTNQNRIEELERQLDSLLSEASKASQERMRLHHDLAAARENLATAQETAANEADRKVRTELQKYESMLAEKQAILEQLLQEPSADPQTMKQLRDRIDELEELNERLTRQNRTLQMQSDELQNQLSGLQLNKEKLDNEISSLNREIIDLSVQIEDQKEIAKETQRQHQGAIAARQVDATTLREQAKEISELLSERAALRSEVDELKSKLNPTDADLTSFTTVDRLEARIRDLEQKLEAEGSAKSRLQIALDRSREAVEKLTFERDRLLESEKSEKEQNRKILRQLRQAQQTQEETARRVLAAQRRADDALSQADQAIKQASSSRSQLDAMAKRTQELEAWIKKKQLSRLSDSDDELYPSFLGDVTRVSRRAETPPLEIYSSKDAILARKLRGPIVRSRSMVFERTSARPAHANQFQKAVFRGLPRATVSDAQHELPAAPEQTAEPTVLKSAEPATSSISSINISIPLRPRSATGETDAHLVNSRSTLTDGTSNIDSTPGRSQTDVDPKRSTSRTSSTVSASTDSEIAGEETRENTTPTARGMFVRNSISLTSSHQANITAVVPEPPNPGQQTVDRVPILMVYESTFTIPNQSSTKGDQKMPVAARRRSVTEPNTVAPS